LLTPYRYDARRIAGEQDRRGREDFRGDPEGQQRDREVIDDRMEMIRADQLRKHNASLSSPLLLRVLNSSAASPLLVRGRATGTRRDSYRARRGATAAHPRRFIPALRQSWFRVA